MCNFLFIILFVHLRAYFNSRTLEEQTNLCKKYWALKELAKAINVFAEPILLEGGHCASGSKHYSWSVQGKANEYLRLGN